MQEFIALVGSYDVIVAILIAVVFLAIGVLGFRFNKPSVVVISLILGFAVGYWLSLVAWNENIGTVYLGTVIGLLSLLVSYKIAPLRRFVLGAGGTFIGVLLVCFLLANSILGTSVDYIMYSGSMGKTAIKEVTSDLSKGFDDSDVIVQATTETNGRVDIITSSTYSQEDLDQIADITFNRAKFRVTVVPGDEVGRYYILPLVINVNQDDIATIKGIVKAESGLDAEVSLLETDGGMRIKTDSIDIETRDRIEESIRKVVDADGNTLYAGAKIVGHSAGWNVALIIAAILGLAVGALSIIRIKLGLIIGTSLFGASMFTSVVCSLLKLDSGIVTAVLIIVVAAVCFFLQKIINKNRMSDTVVETYVQEMPTV